MFDPLHFSQPGNLESDKAEYFLYMQEQERKEKLDTAINKFKRLKNRGLNINYYIDDVMAAAGIDDYTQAEADYIMTEVGV